MEGHKRAVIDTNILVRYLTNDNPSKAKAVDSLLNKALKGELKILIPSIVIAELVWVLESFYEMRANEIAELVEAVVNTPGVEVTDKSIIIFALKLYRAKNMDFIDAWIIEFAKNSNVNTIYTFDKRHFKAIEETEIKIP